MPGLAHATTQAGSVEGEGGYCKHQALHVRAAMPGSAHAVTHVGSATKKNELSHSPVIL